MCVKFSAHTSICDLQRCVCCLFQISLSKWRWRKLQRIIKSFPHIEVMNVLSLLISWFSSANFSDYNFVHKRQLQIKLSAHTHSIKYITENRERMREFLLCVRVRERESSSYLVFVSLKKRSKWRVVDFEFRRAHFSPQFFSNPVCSVVLVFVVVGCTCRPSHY